MASVIRNELHDHPFSGFLLVMALANLDHPSH